jgi:hypothetical protein
VGVVSLSAIVYKFLEEPTHRFLRKRLNSWLDAARGTKIDSTLFVERKQH